MVWAKLFGGTGLKNSTPPVHQLSEPHCLTKVHQTLCVGLKSCVRRREGVLHLRLGRKIVNLVRTHRVHQLYYKLSVSGVTVVQDHI